MEVLCGCTQVQLPVQQPRPCHPHKLVAVPMGASEEKQLAAKK